jgi:ABC-2 type transport system ATP-binding protein
MNFAIETNGLSKFYRQVRAVDSVNLRVKPGEIYGFIGLNGAGKTTTIRALLGLIRPSAGSVQVLGQAVGPNGRGPWRRVGHLVEMPAAYPELTVRDNLQRLGLARALLHEPELLILDEPANGLDPAGVVEIRELLAKLAHEQGVTVFMSSHILTEVDRLATRIGIIHKGRLIEELDAEKLEALRSCRLEIQARDLQAAHNVLTQAGFAVTTKDRTLVLNEARAIDAPEQVATLLVNAGTPPSRLAVEQEDLEDYFLRLTGEKI